MPIGSIGSASVTSTGLTKIAQSSETRVALKIFVDTGVVFVTNLPGAAVAVGIPVTPSSPLYLCEEEDGDIVHHGFYASTSTGTANVGTIQINKTP